MTWWKRRSNRLDDEIQKHIEFEIGKTSPPGCRPLRHTLQL